MLVIEHTKQYRTKLMKLSSSNFVFGTRKATCANHAHCLFWGERGKSYPAKLPQKRL